MSGEHIASWRPWRRGRQLGVLAAGLLGAATVMPVAAGTVVWSDDLRSVRTSRPAGTFENRGGEFTPEGWRMREARGYLRIDLGPAGAPPEGELQVTVTGLHAAKLIGTIGADKKVHLLNMFSNPAGDHHAEGGGRPTDALWTIRVGTDAGIGLRYGGDLKLLWASRGAKRTAGSDYHETRLRLPAGWRWSALAEHQFRVRWSRTSRVLEVRLDDAVLGQFPWRGYGDPLRYVFLGGAADFHAWPGATFRDLRVVCTSLADNLRQRDAGLESKSE